MVTAGLQLSIIPPGLTLAKWLGASPSQTRTGPKPQAGSPDPREAGSWTHRDCVEYPPEPLSIAEVDDATPIRVLVVEDDAWYRDHLTAALLERQFLVRGVADATEFAAGWAQQPADVVVLDIELGRTSEDGLTLASRLRALRSCGVIMASRRGGVDDRIKGLTVGADAYLAKPVNVDELAVTIVNLYRRLR